MINGWIKIGIAVIIWFLIFRQIILKCILVNNRSLVKCISVNNRSLVTNSNKEQMDFNLRLFLQHPHPKRSASNLRAKYSQAHQDETVYEILQKENGFFIEIGAYNGIQFSNTLWLERMHNWTGLLIEANPSLCRQIDELKRNAWRLCSCISTTDQATFITGGAMGGVENNVDQNHMKFLRNQPEITVPCFTLEQVLEYIHVYRIDYFSLDVEGAELFILNTIKKPLKEDKIIIGVWTIEYRVFDGRNIIYNKSIINLQKLRNFFTEIPQYLEHSQLDNRLRSNVPPDGHALDVVFVHIDVWCGKHNELPNKTNCPNIYKV